MALVPHLGADASISDHILYYNEAGCDPAALVHAYRALREWTHASLDLYKVCGAICQKKNLTRARDTKNNRPFCFLSFVRRRCWCVCGRWARARVRRCPSTISSSIAVFRILRRGIDPDIHNNPRHPPTF
jgi:hypothetical protein